MASKTKKLGARISSKGSRAVDRAITKASGNDTGVPGPSPNPATNLIIHDVLLRAGGRLMRTTLEKGLLANRYGKHSAQKMVDNRSVKQALAGYAVSRFATRSVPGAILVSGGLLAKTLFDRSQSRRSAKRAGDKALRKTEVDE
ncbi:hypothetical protein [Tsuneonella amylolytica]|uniref:hypothetical protein n=1 Tax=Tsuneonella amylolytica TaxID=2338327 RepID=UPI001F38CA16|nr:hypothetical protein [Tsuneonella amylolytica]